MFSPSKRGSAVDIYSFGCLMIELFGHKRVWGELRVLEIMQKLCGNLPEPPNVEHIEPSLRAVCSQCTDLASQERPTAHEVLKALRDIM